ncbi:MAG: DUF1697 domain-containing protein [Comamonadaceae bacterium]|nr:DUF1697 domain-containing protein [Comamonadaceae bacterium]
MNAKMADLKACFEKIGCTDVKTIMSSGNVAFTGAPKPEPDWAQHIEAGMAKHLPRGFPVLLRSRDHLLSLLKADPFAALDVLPTEKRVVTLLGRAASRGAALAHRARWRPHPGRPRHRGVHRLYTPCARPRVHGAD